MLQHTKLYNSCHSNNSSSNSDQVAAVLAAKGRIAAATSRAE